MRGFRYSDAELHARRADATDNEPLQSARHGQNDCAIVIGRKGWLFADTPHGAKASARLYSLVETAKANGVEPFAYLNQVFTQLAEAKEPIDYETLLPWRIALPER